MITLMAWTLAAEISVMGAIGDSMTTGFNSRRLGDNREISWSSGDAPDVESHFRRLKARTPSHTIIAYNEAIAGSVSSDLNRQVTRLLRRAPDYVTVTIGANDICSWDVDYAAHLLDYKTKLRAAVQRLVDARPAIKVYLAPIPDMYNLWEIASPRAECRQRWDVLPVCSVLLGSGATARDRAAFVDRWRDANAAIAAVALEFPQHVLHDPELAHTQFEWHHVSPLDCFHPSIAGQNMLSELSWQVAESKL